MIDLLPKYERSRVKREYTFRFLTVSSIVFSVFIIVATVPLAISYVAIYQNIDFINTISEGLSKSESFKEMSVLLKTAKDTNRKINILIGPMGKTSREDLTGVFSSILKTADNVGNEKTSPVKISQISYEQVQKKGVSVSPAASQATKTVSTAESGIHKVTVKGTAVSREDLLSFLKKLELDKNFLSIDSPVSNLVESKNINFLLTVTLRDNKVI